MPETMLQFQSPVQAPDGSLYRARACGGPMPDGMWEGWLEFDRIGGGTTVRSGRETTQPNHHDAEYWATGLTPVFLEGSLRRALDGPIRVPETVIKPPRYQAPAPPLTTVRGVEAMNAHGILDPYSVYQKGEPLLRKQLAALSPWHLVNIILEHELSGASVDTLNATPGPVLIDLIVSRVRETSPHSD